MAGLIVDLIVTGLPTLEFGREIREALIREFKEITTVTTRELTDYGPVKKAVKEFIESRNNDEGSTNE